MTAASSVRRAARSFVRANQSASSAVNRRLTGRVDGSRAVAGIVHDALRPGMTVIDVGGGRSPLIPVEMKRELGLRVIGLDIDGAELAAAPEGAYDEAIEADVAKLDGHDGVADLIFSRSVAEHVYDTPGMFSTSYRVLRPGGVAIHFMPNKFAFFALVNVAVPDSVRTRLLYGTDPGSAGRPVFPPLYRKTYPSAVERLLRDAGFTDIETRCYYRADYLSFLLPAHLVYVGWQLANQRFDNRNLCESFTVIARR
jgi:ubiquinone/menaquinone biosynthesis C-methylase UbiE